MVDLIRQAKEAKDLLEAPYRTCLLDGRKEKVGNFRIEPPSLFRGRGAHPKTGKLKASRASCAAADSAAPRPARADHNQHWSRCDGA